MPSSSIEQLQFDGREAARDVVLAQVPGGYAFIQIVAYEPGLGTYETTLMSDSSSINMDAYALVRLAPVLRALRGMSRLTTNWDSYGGLPIESANRWDAFEFLCDVAEADARIPVPAVYPTSPGGVGLSWQSGDTEVEVAFDRAGDSEIVVIDEGQTTSGPIAQATAVLLGVADRLRPSLAGGRSAGAGDAQRASLPTGLPGVGKAQ